MWLVPPLAVHVANLSSPRPRRWGVLFIRSMALGYCIAFWLFVLHWFIPR